MVFHLSSQALALHGAFFSGAAGAGHMCHGHGVPFAEQEMQPRSFEQHFG